MFNRPRRRAIRITRAKISMKQLNSYLIKLALNDVDRAHGYAAGRNGIPIGYTNLGTLPDGVDEDEAARQAAIFNGEVIDLNEFAKRQTMILMEAITEHERRELFAARFKARHSGKYFYDELL